MVREDPRKIAEQVQKQDDEFYGEETAVGSSPRPDSDDDTEEVLEDFIGKKPTKELNIAEEIDEEEDDLHSLPIDDDDSDDDSSMYSNDDDDNSSDGIVSLDDLDEEDQ